VEVPPRAGADEPANRSPPAGRELPAVRVAATERGVLTLLRRLADNRDPRSLASRFRRRRFELFTSLLRPLPRPVRILDVGGVERFWSNMGAADSEGLEILLLNVNPQTPRAGNIGAVMADARDMSAFGDDEFDVVFSNSAIEHVGDFDDQRQVAAEIRRVGRRYFVQTPNRYFPLEPHFLTPGFQFLPLRARVGLVRRLPLGHYRAMPDEAEARRAVAEIRLLGLRELRSLFPDATVHRERVLGLTKSFVAYRGW
jgi:SAM-dependent methyltransferase